MEIVKYIDAIVGTDGQRPVVMSYSWEDNNMHENELNDNLIAHYGHKSPIFRNFKSVIFVVGKHDMMKIKEPFVGSGYANHNDKIIIIACREKLRKEFPEKLLLDQVNLEKQEVFSSIITGFHVYIYKTK